MLIALCQSTCSCSCQCSTTIMKRMKQATLFGFLVLNTLIILCLPCLSDWFASHHTLCLQEWFVQVNQRGLKQRILWRLHTQGGWLATQFTPLDQPLHSYTSPNLTATCMYVCTAAATIRVGNCGWGKLPGPPPPLYETLLKDSFRTHMSCIDAQHLTSLWVPPLM